MLTMTLFLGENPTMKKCIFLTLIILCFSFIQPALAEPVQSVGLVTFTAVSNQQSISLTWETASELDSIGFRLYRAEEETGFVLLASDIIPASGNPTTGARYAFVDETAVLNTTYTYQLTEIQANNQEIELATATVTPNNTASPIQLQPPTLPTAQPINPTTIQQAPPSNNQEPSQQTTESADRPTITIITNPLEETAETVESIGTDSTARSNEMTVNTNQTIVLLQATPEEPYPAPPTEETPPPDGYVAPPTEVPVIPTFTPEGTAYVPPPTPDGAFNPPPENEDPSITIIGEDQQVEAVQIDTLDEEPVTIEPRQGQIFLWTSFVIALLIFGVAIIATTLIFTRKTQ